MDWRTAAAAVTHLTQQSAQNGGQYSYSSGSYTGQQAPQPSSTGSAAYNPAYLPQAVVPQGYTNTTNYAAGNNAAQQLWSQRSSDPQAQNAYGSRLAVAATIPSGGAAATASASQYGGQYGVYGAAIAQQQLLGVSSKTATVSDYQASSGARTSYGGQDNRGAGSGASYVAGGGGGVSSVSLSGVYGGGAESGKYVTSAGGYANSGVTAPAMQQYNSSSQQQQQQQQQPKSDHQQQQQQQYASYPTSAGVYGGVDQYQQLQPQQQQAQGDGRYYGAGYQDARTSQGLLGAYAGDASGILGALGTYGQQTQTQTQQQQQQQQQQQAYTSRYPPPSPSIGYGGVSLPPGRDYGTGRVSGGTHFQREGSYGRSERPSIGSSRFDERGGISAVGPGSARDLRDEERRVYERERERELLEREREQREREQRERDRERERRDRERENRREEERRNRSPPVSRSRRDVSPRKEDKRKEPSPRRETSHRHSSPSVKESKRREYVFKIETSNVLEAERDCTEVARRHSKLYITPEFSKLLISWTGKENDIGIEKSASFEHESVDIEDEPEASAKTVEKPQKGSVIWNARVMLMSGLTSDCLTEFLSDKNNDKPPNFHKMLKFVALRRDRNAIMPAGGRWDKTLDGGDPSSDDSALIRTAVRTVKESTQIDLSECKEWVRFAEIHYDRLDEDGFPSYKEISVFLLPKIADCLPSLENWHLNWNARKQAKLERDTATKMEKSDDGEAEKEVANGAISEKEAAELTNKEDKNDKDEKKEKEREAKDKMKDEPPEPGFVVVTKRSKTTKMRSMTISLDGLLDYDENDKDESSFELSLFAEAFAEMLQYKMGNQILQNMESLRRISRIRKREDKKRARQVEIEKEDAKRRKAEEVKSADPSKAEVEVKTEQDAKPAADVQMQNSQETAETTEDKARMERQSSEKQSTEKPTAETKDPPSEVKEITPDEKNETPKKEKTGSAKKEKDKKKKTMDKDLLKAYRYFDKNRAGYVKADDLRKLLHSLGKFLSFKIVKELTSCAVSESGRSRDEKVIYRVLAEKELVPTI